MDAVGNTPETTTDHADHRPGLPRRIGDRRGRRFTHIVAVRVDVKIEQLWGRSGDETETRHEGKVQKVWPGRATVARSLPLRSHPFGLGWRDICL